MHIPSEIYLGGQKAYVILENETVFVLKDCSVTGGMVKIPMTPAQFQARFSPERKSVQDVFPELPLEIREIFVSGNTPAEWQKMFGKKQFSKKELVSKFFYHFE